MNQHKISAFLSLLFVVGCASVQMASSEADADAKRNGPAPGMAKLYVIRKWEFGGGGMLMSVIVDGRVAGSLATKTYRVFVLPPGNHELRVSANNTENVKIVALEPDREYFAGVHFDVGGWLAKVAFDDEVQQERAVLSNLRLIQ